NGELFDEGVEASILKSLEPAYIEGLTLLGGDPFEEENQKALLPFLRKVREQYPKKSIWAYTGYVLETDLSSGGRKHTDDTDEMLEYIDVLVDGPFIEAQKNISLKFKGSENQRVIDVNQYRKTGEIVAKF
ncbi:MAG: 4Fe-4S single cluster domain-containing protein, partial [Hespellia sp.]|nr:4Fe-4S single cluster domain-containing protein [Hespellia sp.]